MNAKGIIDPAVRPSPGRVFWITGLSGAGKSTVGAALWQRLRAAGRGAVYLDGDALRAAIAEDLGHSRNDRRTSAGRNARLCQLLASQGEDVVCATISLFHEVQRWNRENIPGYCEIFLRVPDEELHRRDAKGIYAGVAAGTSTDVVGLHVVPQFPQSPDLIIDNHGRIDSAAAVERIWQHCFGAGEPTTAPQVRFSTKAGTLEQVAAHLRSARVLPQVRFTVGDWRAGPEAVISRVLAAPWGQAALIVRSSALGEDGARESLAGKYESVPQVLGQAALRVAVERVCASYGEGAAADDQVFVQPMLTDAAVAGVAFTRRPAGGGPYYVINYDDRSGRTDAVTGGADNLQTFICLKSRAAGIAGAPMVLAPVLNLLRELEQLFAHDCLDVEFAVSGEGVAYLLQVRRLNVDAHSASSDQQIGAALEHVARKVELLSRPHPYLHGTRAIFGVMPDWNPAEIVGLRPLPLSLSLYRELVTDAIWAYQRDNYGYRNLRSFPLLVSFQGLPYIDVRVSFNSFVPRDLPPAISDRLVNHYIDCLLAAPHLHDKVEFEIIFSCYTLDLPTRINRLIGHGFSSEDLAELSGALRRLTNRIMHGDTALWRRDRQKIDRLALRQPLIKDAHLDRISRIYWLLEDCKRYGTLPFAGLARAGFIAVQLLRSFVAVGVLDEDEYTTFMSSVESVGSQIGQDFARLSRAEFLARYGHLRPGTYDILSARYDEAPDLYFNWSANRAAGAGRPRFALSIEQLRQIESLLKQHQLDIDPLSLMEFIKAGIEGREHAKFVFTRSLSDALSLVGELGAEHGLSLEDCAYLDYDAIRTLYSESGDVKSVLHRSVHSGRERHALTRNLALPPLIASPDDVFGFRLPPSEPNFVTRKTVTAPVASIDESPETFTGKVVFIPSADPGFDWVFTRGICGFVTQFGGANSHMAIRANELGIPAVIGAGETLYQLWRRARKISLDCSNQKVTQIA